MNSSPWQLGRFIGHIILHNSAYKGSMLTCQGINFFLRNAMTECSEPIFIFFYQDRWSSWTTPSIIIGLGKWLIDTTSMQQLLHFIQTKNLSCLLEHHLPKSSINKTSQNNFVAHHMKYFFAKRVVPKWMLRYELFFYLLHNFVSIVLLILLCAQLNYLVK